ncbi:hypothetical protein NKV53_10805 [Legionella sp. 27cVA30]|uniref:capsular polysaccharide export protein, LipB/KpsS family n=1 Tax=Legionella sp. 27cVA30 TaxID=2905657 RepID=UPI0020A14716|nr:hypothetical protein [Legionella sp. 27cVA30]MCP0914814.1 hypothetical protein [Legionella sp. 27cVA30]
MYLPWIKTLTNKLIAGLDISREYQFVPLAIFTETHHLTNRQKINFFSRFCPQELREILRNWLTPVANDIKGVILTFDYGFLPREIIKVCSELSILTILIPHESVFLRRDKYYYHPITKIDTPLCDYVLAWGKLQKDIFVSRGYPEARIKVVGAPKFDRYSSFKPRLSHKQFCEKANLNPNNKIILFAAQTLDVQVKQKQALKIQRKIITQLIEFCQQHKCGFILRYPPTELQIIDFVIKKKMRHAGFFIDNSKYGYSFDPEEALYHVDMLISINSTMLFEAHLMGKRALSVKYFEFDENWQKAGIPCVYTSARLSQFLTDWLYSPGGNLPAVTAWAKTSFSPQEFDGLASERIKNFLEMVAKNSLPKLPKTIERIIYDDRPGMDLAYLPKKNKQFPYLGAQIGAKKVLVNKETSLLACADVILCLEKQKFKSKIRQLRQKYQLPFLYVQRGFINLKHAQCSILIDDLGYYYETTRPTRLQQLLNGNQELTRTQENYAKSCMKQIINNDLLSFSKNTQEILGRAGAAKILLIDEAMRAPHLAGGLANKDTFKNMLLEALQCYPDHDILIYYPQEGRGERHFYNKAFLLPYLKEHKNIFMLAPCYPFQVILKHVEEVFVVTANKGFEAVYSGKKVTCFGAPFYSNWGLTHDKVKLANHIRQRGILDVFYFAYIVLSRYYHPVLEKKCQLHELLDYIDLLTLKSLQCVHNDEPHHLGRTGESMVY